MRLAHAEGRLGLPLAPGAPSHAVRLRGSARAAHHASRSGVFSADVAETSPPREALPRATNVFFLRLSGHPGHARLEPRGPRPLPRLPIKKHRAARGVRERAEFFSAREPCRESWLGLTGHRESTAFGVAGGDGHH